MADILHKDLTGAELHEPKTHKTSHQTGGSDQLSLAGLSGESSTMQPPKDHGHTASGSGYGGKLTEAALNLTDVTIANVSISAHGFIPKAPNSAIQFFRGDATWAVPSQLPNFMSYMKQLYGDGADGAATISSNTTLTAGSGGVKVMRYTDLTIDSGFYLEGNSADKVLVILVSGTFTLNGTLRMNARGGAGGTAGGAGNGGNGGEGAVGGGGGGESTGSYSGGGGGGGGISHPTVGYGGNRYPLSGPNTQIQNPFSVGAGCGGDGGSLSVGAAGSSLLPTLLSPIPFLIARKLYGGGGGGGGAASGGAGGAGGGVLWIEAQSIVWGGSGLITANGDNGSANRGGGGGGGFIQLAYKSKTGSSTIQVNGGSGNNPGSYTGGNGAAGLSGEFQIE